MNHPHHGAPAAGAPGGEHAHHSVADFRRRFWVSLALTLPVLALADTIQGLFRVSWRFEGDRWAELVFASAIYFYGGWPFLTGIVAGLRSRRPGMLTLVAVALSTAYPHSPA